MTEISPYISEDRNYYSTNDVEIIENSYVTKKRILNIIRNKKAHNTEGNLSGKKRERDAPPPNPPKLSLSGMLVLREYLAKCVAEGLQEYSRSSLI